MRGSTAVSQQDATHLAYALDGPAMALSGELRGSLKTWTVMGMPICLACALMSCSSSRLVATQSNSMPLMACSQGESGREADG